MLGQFSGAKAEELSFDDVEMVQLTETAAPVQEALSLKHELLNVGDLDVGRYQAILIQDPDNKKNIRFLQHDGHRLRHCRQKQRPFSNCS